MDAVFSFLFGTRTGFAILFAGGILLFAIIAFVMGRLRRPVRRRP